MNHQQRAVDGTFALGHEQLDDGVIRHPNGPLNEHGPSLPRSSPLLQGPGHEPAGWRPSAGPDR